MAITLVATVGSATANSYNTAAELTAIAALQFPRATIFERADDDDVARAAVTATRFLEQMQFVGDRVDATQALSWPRYGVRLPTGAGYYDGDVIPDPVKLAHAKLTFYLLEQAAAGVDPFAVAKQAGLSAIAFGSEMSMSFEAGATSVTPGRRFLATVVRPTLGPLVYAEQLRVVR
jgi:hypothetical protein